MTILLVAEHRNNKLLDPTLEQVTLARRLSEKGAGAIHAALMGSGVEPLAQQLAGYGVTVHYVDSPALAHEVPGAYAKALEGIIAKVSPSLVLFGHTSVGYDVAPRLAARKGWPIATNVARAEWEGGLKAWRALYGGRAHAEVQLQGTPALLTLQTGAFPAAKEQKPGGSVQKGEVTVAAEDTRQKVTGFVQPEVTGVDISAADVIVAVGRGLKDKENVKLAEELAKALGGVVAGSRPIVDAGWLPRDRQVGVSGKTVKAKLYIALGISGQVQHLSGMKGCETIVAVNKDPNAPIFKVAHIGVTGDVFKVIPALMKELAA
ncbi:MAG TPA: electron transfer flavoprotein subunit alpha/FixB family protein [Candidatus Thermoplasmatota archaeon]|jgi:electron transfer flavoprotein alpha subunit|nr:electron transfer flavoprotein subunit alpha/FixB family protein [Candidatus Thermoplasmatota archaeon]